MYDSHTDVAVIEIALALQSSPGISQQKLPSHAVGQTSPPPVFFDPAYLVKQVLCQIWKLKRPLNLFELNHSYPNTNNWPNQLILSAFRYSLTIRFIPKKLLNTC